MPFEGPDATDFANVTSLNRAFLTLLASGGTDDVGLDGLAPPLERQLASLDAGRIERLASTPFLLLSLRERDAAYWERILAPGRTGDLFGVPKSPGDAYQRVVSAALAFVWQLSRQNPYAARLICGASVHWSETLAERTFYALLSAAGHRRDLLVLRSAGDQNLWRKLLQYGAHTSPKIRHAAHVCALQSLLTRQQTAPATRLATAACGFRQKGLRVAEEGKR